MTLPKVRFYVNEADSLARALALIARAYRSGRWIAVRCADEAQRAALDKLLWESQPGVFLPAVFGDDALAPETPIVLLLPHERPTPARPVWVQLARAPLESLPAAEWILEVVGRSEAEKAPARERWRRYQAAGCSVSTV